MMKDLRNYLHFYIGSFVYDSFNDEKVLLTPSAYVGYMNNWKDESDRQIVLLLVPVKIGLMMMNSEEKRAFNDSGFIGSVNLDLMVWTPEAVLLACKHCLDIFDLIGAGLAKQLNQ